MEKSHQPAVQNPQINNDKSNVEFLAMRAEQLSEENGRLRCQLAGSCHQNPMKCWALFMHIEDGGVWSHFWFRSQGANCAWQPCSSHEPAYIFNSQIFYTHVFIHVWDSTPCSTGSLPSDISSWFSNKSRVYAMSKVCRLKRLFEWAQDSICSRLLSKSCCKIVLMSSRKPTLGVITSINL